VVSGDLYISYERVLENSSTFKKSLQEETHRVIIHGVMHLCGYKDKTKSDALMMRQKEETSLLKIQNYINV
jgi:rRNA maturation RNase YbeY